MTGAELIAAERQRQIEVEGYTAEHDVLRQDELALAGACYALPTEFRDHHGHLPQPDQWPWHSSAWKPTPEDRVRELVKAGALIAAAIDSAQEV